MLRQHRLVQGLSPCVQEGSTLHGALFLRGGGSKSARFQDVPRR